MFNPQICKLKMTHNMSFDKTWYFNEPIQNFDHEFNELINSIDPLYIKIEIPPLLNDYNKNISLNMTS